MPSEEQIAIAITNHYLVTAPDILIHHDFGSGTKLSISQAKRQKALNPRRGHPDLMIYEPRGKYVGLAIELKRDGVKIAKKDGSPVSQHIKEQNDYLEALHKRGWRAFFCIGYDDAVKTIDNYLGIDTLKVEF
jgi:hypothetical protein